MTGARELLTRIAAALDEANVPFMIAGSFASTAHGTPRTTQDLDIVIDPPSSEAFEALLDALPKNAYYVDHDIARDALRRRTMFNIVDHASGWKVDFILRKNRPFSIAEFARRNRTTLLGVSLFVVCRPINAEGLVGHETRSAAHSSARSQARHWNRHRRRDLRSVS